MQLTSGLPAPDGTSTAFKINDVNTSYIQQTISAANSTTYTFSVYVRADTTGTYPTTRIALKSNADASWEMYNEVINMNNYKYVNLYGSTDWKRFYITWTTPSSGVTNITARISISGSTDYNSVRIWGAQLRQSDMPGIYMATTDSSIVDSAAIFHGDGSRLTNLSAVNISGIAGITGVTGNDFAINADATTPADDMTLTFNRGTTGDAILKWNESGSRFEMNDDLQVSGVIVAGTTPHIITTEAGLLDATKLSGTIPTTNLPADGYASTYVNTSGDTMTGALTLSSLIAASGTDVSMKLGDAAGANKLSVQTSAGAERFSVLSDGTVKVAGGYTGTAGGGITLEPDGDVYFDGNLYQTGTTYTVDTVRITGNYNAALVSKFGVGAAGADTDYLQIDTDGHISDYDDPVTISDALLQTGASNQVTFQGNVNAQNGLDVTGTALTAGAGFTLSSGALNLPNNSVTDAMVSDTLTASNLVAAGSVVSDAEVDNDITIASSNAGSFAGLTTTTLSATGDITGSATKLDIDKTYTNQEGAVTDHTITRNVVLSDASAKTISGNVVSINAADTQTSGTLTDNSTLLRLQTGANVGAGGYFIYAEDNSGSQKFSIDKDGNLYTVGTQTIVGATLYDGTQIVDITSSEAFLVRKDSDAKDILIADTTNSQVEIYDQLGIGKTPVAGAELDVLGDADFSGTIKAGTGDAFQVSSAGGVTAVGANIGTGNLVSNAVTIIDGDGVVNASVVEDKFLRNDGADSTAGKLTAAGFDASSSGLTNTGAISGATTIVASSYVRQLASIGFVPEYDNAAAMGDGANNFGTLSLKYDSATGHSYYEWTTTEPTAQDYDIVVRYRLPDGFLSFDATGPIKLFNKVSDATGNTSVTVTMLDTAGTSVSLSGGSALKNAAWTESTITITGSPTFAAGGYVTIIIKVTADQGDTVDIGELTMKGNW